MTDHVAVIRAQLNRHALACLAGPEGECECGAWQALDSLGVLAIERIGLAAEVNRLTAENHTLQGGVGHRVVRGESE